MSKLVICHAMSRILFIFCYNVKFDEFVFWSGFISQGYNPFSMQTMR